MTLTSFWDGMVPPQVNIGYTWCVARHIPQRKVHMKKDVVKSALTVLAVLVLIGLVNRLDGPYTVIQSLDDGELKTIKVKHQDVKSIVDSLELNGIEYWID